ncbi:P-loop NTPase [Faecalitalea cylindroides]|uniref:nucleotide-binding protein n=1 Tax=Faecalitalea cylindroides TaxID=39483 RepID=UPI0039F480F8
MNRNEMDFGNISFYGILRELKRYLVYIVIFTVSVWLFITGLGQLLYTPEYTVSTTLVVTDKTSENNYASLSLASSMADVMSEIFQSDAMKELVETDIGNTMEGRITCSQVPETNLLVLNIISTDPSSAYAFMNSALTHYSEVSSHVFSNASLQVLQEPSIPTSPSNRPRFSNHKNVLTLAACLGMCVLISFLYIFRYTLKTPTNAKKVLDGTILGVIPFEKNNKKRSKKALLINLPIISMAYSEAYRRVVSRIEHSLRKKNKQVLLVTSAAENEGKSTCAANIALALQEKGKKVLLIDCDFMKPAQYKIFERRIDKEMNGYRSIQYNEKTHLWELFLSKPVENHINSFINRLKQMIEYYRSEFDYLILDSSPTKASSDAEVLMDIVDCTLMVVKEDYSDIRIINDTVDLIWQSNSKFIGFVLNSFHEQVIQNNAYGYGYYKKSMSESR